MTNTSNINLVKEVCHVGDQVAGILLTLAGGDPSLVIACSRKANGLDQCKAFIIDARLADLEFEVFDDDGGKDVRVR